MKVNPLIVALDTGDKEVLQALVEHLAPVVGAFKVGFYPFLLFGWDLVNYIHSRGSRVFLDLKLHDIPNTVAIAVEVAAHRGVFMVNLHTLGGREMMERAAQVAREISPRPLLLGVTVLTSMETQDLKEVGIQGPVEHRVLSLARLAHESGLDGVVASPQEARTIKEELGKEFVIVTPGVRPPGSPLHDQKRVATPREALLAGAHYIVVGRPICQAPDPVAAAREILEDLGMRTEG